MVTPASVLLVAMPTRMKDLETNLKLAALGCVDDHKAGEMYVADYILYHLNRMRRFDYVRVLGLPGPTNDIQEVREVHTPQEKWRAGAHAVGYPLREGQEPAASFFRFFSYRV